MKQHYLHKAVKQRFPDRFLFLDTETLFNTVNDIDYHYMRLGITCYLQTDKDPNNIVDEKWDFFRESEPLNEYIESLAWAKKPLWIIASNPKFDIGAMGFVKFFTNRGWELSFIAEKGFVFILSIKKDKKTIKIVALQNYLQSSIAAIGKLFNFPKVQADVFTKDMDLLTIYCFRDVEILMCGFMNYIQYVHDNDLGSFAATKTGQAFNAFRHRFMKDYFYIHKDKQASSLERSGYFGGRVECFRIGEMPKQDYIQLDINSMYPFVMKDNYYPTRLKGKIEAGNIPLLNTLLGYKCVTARCLVNTDEPVYPVQYDGRCCFPVGKFWTTLNTRGLQYAIKHNHLVNFSHGYYYDKARCFRTYVEYLWGERLKAQKEGNKVKENMIKIFLNSFYGKWAQRIPIMMTDEYTESDAFNHTTWHNAVTKETGIDRTLFHRHQTLQGEQLARNSFVTIAAHVTEDSRFYLWEIMKQCGLENVYYCDTDCVITTKGVGDINLADKLGIELGQLKPEFEADTLTLHGLKDYVLGEKIRRKGVNMKAKVVGENRYKVLTNYSFKTMAKLGLDDCAVLTHVFKTLKRQYTKGVIQADGSILPFLFSEEADSFDIDSF